MDSRRGDTLVTQVKEPSRSRSGSSSMSRRDTLRASHAPSKLSAVPENQAMVPYDQGDLKTQTRSSRHPTESSRHPTESSRHPTQSSRHQDSRSSRHEPSSSRGDYTRDSQRTVRPSSSNNEGWSRAVLPTEYEKATSSGNSRAVALREKTVTRSPSTRSGMTTVRAGSDSRAMVVREPTVTRSGSTRTGMTMVPAGPETRGAGLETRLERLEQGSVSRSHSTRAGSSSGAGFETRLRELEKPKHSETTKTVVKGETTKLLEKKLESMQDQMNQMKLDSHQKELQAKDDKIKEVQRELDAERAKDKSAPIFISRRHGVYCTCYYCF